MEKKSKRGRPTIASNLLLGTRNAWVCLLEEAWPEIGWPLICIRNQRTSTIEDIQKAMVSLREKPNGGLAARFYGGASERASPSEIRRNWKSISRLDPRILEMQAKRNTQERLCSEAELALIQAEEMLKDEEPKVKETILLEITRRKEILSRTTENVRKLESDRDAVYKKVIDQESYFCRSELLDFLRSRRYAVKPRPLANALAGLANMRWRQSHSRCSKMPYGSEPHLWYRAWDAVRKVLKRMQTQFNDAPLLVGSNFFRRFDPFRGSVKPGALQRTFGRCNCDRRLRQEEEKNGKNSHSHTVLSIMFRKLFHFCPKKTGCRESDFSGIALSPDGHAMRAERITPE